MSMKNDLISRQDVLDYIDTMPSELTSDGRRMVRRIRLTEYITDTLPSAEPEPKWIPVTEALPKNYEQTICIDSRGKMMIGMYGEYGWTFPCYMTEPVAWMPLPEPYRGE